MALEKVNIYWFRKCLRLHDNEPLLRLAQQTTPLLPIFIFDSKFLPETRDSGDQEDCTGALSGQNQFQFLLECLTDLDDQLQAMGSKLCVFLNRTTEDVFQHLVTTFDVQALHYAKDSEPFAQIRDATVTQLMEESGVVVSSSWAGHTLVDLDEMKDHWDGKVPKAYKSYWPVVETLTVPASVELVTAVPPLPALDLLLVNGDASNLCETVPTLTELGFPPLVKHSPFYGGERQGLERMEAKLSNTSWVCGFEKPKTSPASLQPSTTVLSPYLTLGCVSARYFYHQIQEVYRNNKHTKPPMSLHGQLYFREWFYYLSYTVPNFDKMEGNPLCLQVDWEMDAAKIQQFKEGRTGLPWIDAAMRQLREEGWIHHLARHAVACFFTRGQLYQHWEEGKKIFAEYLLDGDYALNAANWMWLSCSAFFTAYFRVYGVESFPKKYDKAGVYVKKYCPELRNMPSKYIYCPWDAPLHVQQEAKCIIGVDYPHPMVDYKEAKQECMPKMKAAYARKQRGTVGSQKRSVADAELGEPEPLRKKQRRQKPKKKQPGKKKTQRIQKRGKKKTKGTRQKRKGKK